MKDWLLEIIDQVALGEILANSAVTCGQRFGLIAIDNAVEFMLIAYIEIYKQLLRGGTPGRITKKDWDDTKREFPKLLAFVAAREPNLQPLEADISRYHNYRNGLYHTGTPVTPPAKRVLQYSKLAKQLLAVLFSISLSSDEWASILSQNASALCGDATPPSIKRQVTYQVVDTLVTFATTASLTATEAVALCLFGYSTLTGAPPSKPSLIQALARSGHPLSSDVLNARLHDLKKNGWLQRNELVLSAKGRKELAKKFLLSSCRKSPIVS